MDKLILDVHDFLNNVSDGEDQCIDRLIGSLKKRNGVHRITLEKNENSIFQLYIHFEKETISEDHIKHIARQTGKKLDNTFGHLWFKMQRVHDTSHSRSITTLLTNFRGVMNVLVIPTGWIFLEFNTYITQESILKELIGKMDLII